MEVQTHKRNFDWASSLLEKEKPAQDTNEVGLKPGVGHGMKVTSITKRLHWFIPANMEMW